MVPQFYHSVTLDSDKCMGCTNCIKHCPTEAIRVRNKKAQIISNRCIDCGMCIRVCPHHAKKAKSDSLDVIESYTYKIALPAPSLFGQFNHLSDLDPVLQAFKQLGFDDVFEVSRGAELVSGATRQLMKEGKLPRPVISSACPAVVRLIRARFPDLCDHVLKLNSPMEVSAMVAKQEAAKRTGLPLEQIGAFFITPCPAKVTEINAPIGTNRSWLDGAIAISTIYPKLSQLIGKIEVTDEIAHSGIIGVSWASSGGEATAQLTDQYLAADGIENVIRVLEELEDERIGDIEFIELNACPGGCVGGVLTVENAYVAQARIHKLRRYLPVSQNHLQGEVPSAMQWENGLEYTPVLNLSDDLEEAMRMMEEIDTMTERLPGLDCGSCGAPSCRALAEDVVKKLARPTDCIFILREQVQHVATTLSSIGSPFEEKEEKE